MKLTVNKKDIECKVFRCVYISKCKKGFYDYTATIKFISDTDLTQYEKACVGDYIEELLAERTKP